MIKIVVRKQGKKIKGFNVTGHADFADHGEDIVCSAVSMLTQTAVIGLHKVAKVKTDYEISDGLLRCDLPEALTELQDTRSSAILDTMYEGLKNIKKSYKKYIEIVEKEEV